MDANQPIALVLSSCSRALNIQHEILWEPKTSEVSCLGKATAVVRLNYSVQKTINTVVGKSRPSNATGSEPRSLRERFIVEVKKISLMTSYEKLLLERQWVIRLRKNGTTMS